MAKTVQNIILDASVIVKWFLLEEDSDKALFYLDAFNEGSISIIIPHLLFYELGNVCLTKQLARDDVENIAQKLSALTVKVIDIASLTFSTIYHNAVTFKLSFYDASYVALMEQEHCQFITADKKLYNKIHKAFPQTKLL